MFSDRLVGDKARDKFESILSSVLQTDWSVDLATHSEGADSAFYVTWGHSPSSTDLSLAFGRPLGRLLTGDMEEMVAKAIISYGMTERQEYCSIDDHLHVFFPLCRS